MKSPYYAGYVTVAVLIILLLIGWLIAVSIMFTKKIGIFSNPTVGPADSTQLVQPNLQYYNTPLTAEQQTQKKQMVEDAQNQKHL